MPLYRDVTCSNYRLLCSCLVPIIARMDYWRYGSSCREKRELNHIDLKNNKSSKKFLLLRNMKNKITRITRTHLLGYSQTELIEKTTVLYIL